ncbi:MAG: DUF222 domain-containing protein, partial [Jatrophihabitans sp.]|uniref:DUF222 domain-containing protein n=1 Tax=Jatrophihabitans sp. TaxID=1932789 RepID=UPI003F7D8D49
MTDAAILERFEVLHKAIDAFGECAAGGGFGQLSDDEFIDLARDLEALRRSLGTVDDAVVTDVERRELPHKQLTRTTAGFLSALWRLTAGEARQRVTAARQCGTRVAFSGEPLPPLRPHLAAARTAGVVTPAQVALIVKTLADLPPRLTPHQLDEAERSLVQAAHALNLADLKIVCDKLAFCYDQDGPAPDDQVQQARRFLDARPLSDGMVAGSYRLAGVDGAKLLAFL